LGHDALDDYPEDPGAELDRAGELREKCGTETGQLWDVGKHRILCGDATGEVDLARLIGGGRGAPLLDGPTLERTYRKNDNPRCRKGRDRERRPGLGRLDCCRADCARLLRHGA
jgi:hypothetical protein